MATLYIDCEFNGFGGDLISLALVDGCGQEFYHAVPCDNPVPWVAENVLPVLGECPVTTMRQVTGSLFMFLNQFDAIHIVADWPDDIAYFCRCLITEPGERINTPPLTMEILRFDSPSNIPHNALEDARGIAKAHMGGRVMLPVSEYEAATVACDPSIGSGDESKCLASWVREMEKSYAKGEGHSLSQGAVSALLHTLYAAKYRCIRLVIERDHAMSEVSDV